ncbi:hypothetical protein [Granulicella tundricola]|uniref:Cytochrome c domain-containing protein n=1 Tax=Granulicella tundricola (strain ATCC BAA-1859 / DSM 23138 / MP5ACTX9) TaxID=1198114 RepID=E8X3T9_GRATM|nr:hypothetical protein [Granulicella tundricola]ADW69367.1 hypothetical protein AciX9_2330 [Granulicella tundricola MP5ACTX9]
MRAGRVLVFTTLLLLLTASLGAHLHRTRAQTGYVCPDGSTNCYQMSYVGLTDLQRQGRDTWYFWTGGDRNPGGTNVVGDQALWRHIATETHGQFDLIQSIDSRHRGQRFKQFGIISDPDCRKASAPDQYGLWIDDCTSINTPPLGPAFGKSAGIIGLRIFPNPNFDPKKWNVDAYRKDAASVEPPYLVGMTCAMCHVGFNPLHPPADPENPQWHNLNPGIGNQYFREQIFSAAKFPMTQSLQPNDFRWQLAHSEPAGTSETSQVATDHIFNPNTINHIAYINDRPTHAEVTADGVHRNVYHILKDGSDSVGSACLDDPTPHPGQDDTACAALRVYINIGVCANIWTTLQDPIYGLQRPQSAFDPKQARLDPNCNQGWTDTEARMGGLESFLRTLAPLHLADADNGQAYLPKDTAVLTRGKAVFAEQCASCHSSKRPPADNATTQAEWFRQAVMADDFLQKNYLSDDARHPISEIKTNSARAMGTNATAGHIWANFSSDTYKQLPPVHIDGLVDPFHTSLKLLPFEATGGRGYYRTPNLANIWATAPLLHNNSVGLYNGDPSVAGRLAAYQDAMEKLLWPERRPGVKSIQRTSQASKFFYEEGGSVCIAKGTPVSLIANVDVVTPEHFRKDDFFTRFFCKVTGTGHLNALFLLADNAPDFVQDRGHTFGAELPDADKKALIEYMKLF